MTTPASYSSALRQCTSRAPWDLEDFLTQLMSYPRRRWERSGRILSEPPFIIIRATQYDDSVVVWPQQQQPRVGPTLWIKTMEKSGSRTSCGLRHPPSSRPELSPAQSTSQRSLG